MGDTSSEIDSLRVALATKDRELDTSLLLLHQNQAVITQLHQELDAAKLALSGLTSEYERVSARLQSTEREIKTLRGEAHLRVRFVSNESSTSVRRGLNAVRDARDDIESLKQAQRVRSSLFLLIFLQRFRLEHRIVTNVRRS